MAKGNVEDFLPPLAHAAGDAISHHLLSQLRSLFRAINLHASQPGLRAGIQAGVAAGDGSTSHLAYFLRLGRPQRNPFQVVYRQVQLPWEECDWQGLAPAAQQQQLETFLKSDRERGFRHPANRR
jgi:hypothetical protein